MSSRIPESPPYAQSPQHIAAQNNQALAREHMRARSKVIMNLVFNILVGLVTFTTLPWQLAAGITAGSLLLTALLGGFSVPEVVAVARRRFSSGQLLGGSQPSAPNQRGRSFVAAVRQDSGLAPRLPAASRILGTNVVSQPVADGRQREEVGTGVSSAPHFVAARSVLAPASNAAPAVHVVAAPAGPQVLAPARSIPQSNVVLQPVAQPGPRVAVGTGVSEAPHLAAARSAGDRASNAPRTVQPVAAPVGLSVPDLPQYVLPASQIPGTDVIRQQVANPEPREYIGVGVSRVSDLRAAQPPLAPASNAAPVVPTVVAPAGPQVTAPIPSISHEPVGSGANRRGLGLAAASPASRTHASSARERPRPTSVQFATNIGPTPSLVLGRSPLAQRTAPGPLSSARGSIGYGEEGAGSPFALEGATPPIPRMGDMPPPPAQALQSSRVSTARTAGVRQPTEPPLPPKPPVREPVGAGRNRNQKG